MRATTVVANSTGTTYDRPWICTGGTSTSSNCFGTKASDLVKRTVGCEHDWQATIPIEGCLIFGNIS